LNPGSGDGVTPYFHSGAWTSSANLFNDGGGIGMAGVTSPRAGLEVGGREGLLVTGTVNAGTARTLGAGVRLHWYPRRGAFRVGMAETNYWDDNGTSVTNMALYSIGMGYQPRPTGTASVAIGAYTKATGDYSLALGSYSTASGAHSIALGTSITASGIYSMALGCGADTNGKDGALVIGDDTYFQTTYAPNDNCFVARFCSGANTGSGNVSYKFFTGYPTDTAPNVYMLYNDNAWRSSCSRELKENFTPVDGEWLLGRVRALPITRWNYKTADPSVQFIGPVAEDFWTAFRLGGDDDKGINTFALAGVTLAGVQALEERSRRLESRLAEQEARIDALSRELEALRASLAAGSLTGSRPGPGMLPGD
jgi:hypothetical protein